MTLPTNTLMAVALSRQLGDGEIGFIGVGSSGRAFELVTAIPILAARIAQAQGRDFQVQVGPLLEPDLGAVPDAWEDERVYSWASATLLTSDANLDGFCRGRVDVGFISGAQIDRWGNINVSRVMTPNGWRRLGGALAVPEHCAFAGRTLIVADLSARTFVEDVDFITGVGHRARGVDRNQLGLPGGGPAMVVSNFGLFDFGPNGIRLRAVYPGVSVDAALAQMSCRPDIADPVEVFEPTPLEVDLAERFSAHSPTGDVARPAGG